jgi:methylmalonyl-CoA/ethylmalonyl-CoA epimerase
MKKELKRWQASGARVFIEPEIDPIQKVCCALVGFPLAVPFELVAPAPDLPVGEKSPVDTRIKRGGGLDHVCYFVDDVSIAVEACQKRGGALIVEPVYGVVFDRAIAFLHMRTGLIIELMCRKAEGRKLTDPLKPWFSAMADSVGI